MSAELDLARLLAGMRPSLRPGIFVFCSVPAAPEPLRAAAVATFREAEGMTLVLAEEEASRHGLAGGFRSAWITLEVASDLAAVGFLARVATALAGEGIACNAISAFHHDHLFVPAAEAERAIRVLERLSGSSPT